MKRQKNKVNNENYSTIFETPSTRNVPTLNSPTILELPDELENFSKHFNLKLKPFLQYTNSLPNGIPKIYKSNIVISCLKTDVTNLSIKSISKTMLHLDNIELYQIITNDIPLVTPCIKDVITRLYTKIKRRRYGY